MTDFVAAKAVGGLALQVDGARIYAETTIPASMKFVVFINASLYYIFSKTPGGGAVLDLIYKDQTTLTNSLGVNQETFRQTRAYGLHDAALFRRFSARTGTWADSSALSPNALGYPADSTLVADATFTYAISSTVGDYIDFVVRPGSSGRANLNFWCTSTSVTSAEISIAETGEILKAGINTRRVGSANFARQIEISGLPNETVTLRVKHTGTPGDPLNVMPADIYKVGDNRTPIDKTYNGWWYIRPGTTGLSTLGLNDYVDTLGASGYAFREVLTQKYGGDFHGGQVVDVVGGVPQRFAFTDGVLFTSGLGPRPCMVFSIRQSSRIDWSGANPLAGYLDVSEEIRFVSDGCVEHRVSLSGTAVSDVSYFTMTPSKIGFTKVVFPKTLSTTSEGNYPIGRTDTIAQINPSTGQQIVTTSNPANSVHVNYDVGNDYAKGYFALIGGIGAGPPMLIGNQSWIRRVQRRGS